MKIAIVCPPFSDFYTTPHRLVALGAATVKRVLEGIAPVICQVFNFPALSSRGIPLPKDLDYMKPFLLPGEMGPTRFFTHYKMFGPPIEECLAILNHFNPQAIVLSHFAYAYTEDLLPFLEGLKRKFPHIPIIAGGSGVSAHSAFVAPYVNNVIIGTIEKNYREILQCLNLPFKGGAPHNPYAFFLKTKRSPGHYTVSLSRGCPRKCSFCSNFLCHGRTFLLAPLEDMFNEVSMLPEKGALHINFEDDNILFRKDYFFALLEAIKKRNSEAAFSAENGLDYGLLKEKELNRLIDLGFRQFNFSLAVTSGVSAINQDRFLEWEHFSAILNRCGERKIPVIAYFIAGLQKDTIEDLKDTLIRMSSLPTLLGISPFYPVPGLPSLSPVQQDLAIRRPVLCKGSSHYPWNDLSTKDLVTAFRLSRWLNWAKLQRPSELANGSADLRNKQLLASIRRGSNKDVCQVPNLNTDLVKEVLDGYLQRK